MRHREKGFVSLGFRDFGQSTMTSYGFWPTETMDESSTPGSCNVVHVKHSPMNGVGMRNGTSQTCEYRNIPGFVPEMPPPKLNWNKLPTSNQSGIIQIMAELDESIYVFTKRFWRSLSVGSVTWGVLPLISDLKALLTAIINLGQNLKSFRYEDYHKGTVSFDTSPNRGADRWFGTMNWSYHLTGKGDVSFVDDASILLDRLGFHPDLATVWDLIPLSFVVDYILPVGDFLEEFRQGGWVRKMYFTGWQTSKREVNGSFDPASSYANAMSAGYGVEIFTRHASLICLEAPDKRRFDDQGVPELKLPSIKNMFLMAYLAQGKLNPVIDKRNARRFVERYYSPKTKPKVSSW